MLRRDDGAGQVPEGGVQQRRSGRRVRRCSCMSWHRCAQGDVAVALWGGSRPGAGSTCRSGASSSWSALKSINASISVPHLPLVMPMEKRIERGVRVGLLHHDAALGQVGGEDAGRDAPGSLAPGGVDAGAGQRHLDGVEHALAPAPGPGSRASPRRGRAPSSAVRWRSSSQGASAKGVRVPVAGSIDGLRLPDAEEPGGPVPRVGDAAPDAHDGLPEPDRPRSRPR